MNENEDTVFFSYLNRLVDAPKFRERERIDGRSVLDGFISGKKSLIYEKKVKETAKKMDEIKKMVE